MVSKSSTEAKFRALSNRIDEALWIRGVFKELKILYKESIKILSDNRSTICISHDPMYHDRIKHIDIDKFYINEKVEEKIIRIDQVSSAKQCADFSLRDY